MPTSIPKDNSTFNQKSKLRTEALRELRRLVPTVQVMETHGGYGRLFARCYADIVDGIVFETNPTKSAALALQRPTWAVYEADCVNALAAGAGGHLEINFLDLDPYGECWPVLDAFFTSKRPRAPVLMLVVNDGLRQKLAMHGGWSVASLQAVVQRYGNARLYATYREICRELVEEKAAKAGYSLSRWVSYYCRGNAQMTHFAGLLQRAA